jgi:hypothetical protein
MFYYLPVLFIPVIMMQNVNVAIIRYEFSKVRGRPPEPDEEEVQEWNVA